MPAAMRRARIETRASRLPGSFNNSNRAQSLPRRRYRHGNTTNARMDRLSICYGFTFFHQVISRKEMRDAADFRPKARGARTESSEAE